MKQLLKDRLKKMEAKQEKAQAMQAQQEQKPPPKAEGKPDLKQVG
jgi:hypothetical protein